MVSTTTWRPRSAARSASAADVVVLPTPPGAAAHDDPGGGVVEQGVDVEARGARAGAAGRGPTRTRLVAAFARGSCHAPGSTQVSAANS